MSRKFFAEAARFWFLRQPSFGQAAQKLQRMPCISCVLPNNGRLSCGNYFQCPASGDTMLETGQGGGRMNDTYAKPTIGGDLLQRVQDRYAKLRPSEQIVADYLRTHANQRLSHSITELAQIMGVSEATISRVSRALGYSGFSDLKLSLAEGAVNRSGLSNIPAELDPSDTLIGTSVKLANLLAASIQSTQASLDGEKLDRCLH
ncbi:MAG: hypothetical protein WCS20_14500, partial [Alphaproteobacteria bacterium]